MNEKHAGDPVYVATVEEELRNIELHIVQAEMTLGLREADASPELRACRVPAAAGSAAAIRGKSEELAQRLRRIERARATKAV